MNSKVTSLTDRHGFPPKLSAAGDHLCEEVWAAIKYISRFRQKGGIQDLEKAKHCIDMLKGAAA